MNVKLIEDVQIFELWVYARFQLSIISLSMCTFGIVRVVLQARPSCKEKGSGELPRVELFWPTPKTGWSRNVIMKALKCETPGT